MTAAESATSEEAWREQRELWGWARKYCDERIGQYAMEETNEVYTAEERTLGIENVRTGLRRNLDEEKDEDEDEDEEEGAAAEGGNGGVPEEVRRVARLKLVRDGVVGRYELPQNADWQAKGRPGMPGRPGVPGMPMRAR